MLRPPSQPGSHASRPTAYLPPAAGPGSTGVSNTMRAMACSSNHRHALSSNHMGAAQWRRATAAVPQQVPAPPTQLQAPTSSPSANHIVSGPRHTSAASGPAARAQLSTEQQEANTTGTHQGNGSHSGNGSQHSSQQQQQASGQLTGPGSNGGPHTGDSHSDWQLERLRALPLEEALPLCYDWLTLHAVVVGQTPGSIGIQGVSQVLARAAKLAVRPPALAQVQNVIPGQQHVGSTSVFISGGAREPTREEQLLVRGICGLCCIELLSLGMSVLSQGGAESEDHEEGTNHAQQLAVRLQQQLGLKWGRGLKKAAGAQGEAGTSEGSSRDEPLHRGRPPPGGLAVPLGIEHLDAPSVSGLLGALGLLAARRVLPTGDRDLPREVQLAAEMLARRARRLAAAGALGPNQLAYCLRGAALLAPRYVDERWLREVLLQLRRPGIMARLAPDSVAALMSAMTVARRGFAPSWRPPPSLVIQLEAEVVARLREYDGHQLAVTVHGITDLLGTAVAEYGSTDSDAADQESAPAADQEEGSQASARAVSPVVNVPWLPEVMARERLLTLELSASSVTPGTLAGRHTRTAPQQNSQPSSSPSPASSQAPEAQQHQRAAFVPRWKPDPTLLQQGGQTSGQPAPLWAGAGAGPGVRAVPATPPEFDPSGAMIAASGAPMASIDLTMAGAEDSRAAGAATLGALPEGFSPSAAAQQGLQLYEEGDEYEDVDEDDQHASSSILDSNSSASEGGSGSFDSTFSVNGSSRAPRLRGRLAPRDLALLLVSYARAGAPGFWPCRPAELQDLPLEAFWEELEAEEREEAARQGGGGGRGGWDDFKREDEEEE